MKKTFLWPVLSVLLATLAGCSRSNHNYPGVEAQKEAPITGSSDDSAVEFKTQWKPNERYQFYFRQVQTMAPSKTDAGGGGGKHRHDGGGGMESIFAEDYTLTATNEPSEKGAKLNYQIQALEFDMAYGGDTYDFVFDTENKAVPPGNDAMSTALQRLIGGEMVIDMSVENKFRKVSGRRSLTQRALDKLDTSRSGYLVDRTLVDETLRHLCEFVYLPDKPVKIGDSWKVKSEIVLGNNTAKVEATCTFKGWQRHEQRKCALFAVEGAMEKVEPSDKNRLEDGQLSGRIWFDADLGMTAGAEIDQSAITTSTRKRSGETTKVPVTQSMSLMLVEAIPGEKKADAVN